MPKGSFIAFICLGLMLFSFQLNAQDKLKAWTSETPANDREIPQEKRVLNPVKIIAVRNGTFSGKVMIAAPKNMDILNPKASLTPLKGPGSIPAENIQVRYAVPYPLGGWMAPVGPDTLLETPPEKVSKNTRGTRLLAVWVTVRIPADAKAGEYKASVTVQADGLSAKTTDVNVEVIDWQLPDPQDYRTWIDMVQSPDTLAVEYGTELWSEKHWDLIANSFRLMSGTGARTMYIPLICHANIGNEESMVRWVKKGEHDYEFDFSTMEKYLDTAEKNLGRPKKCFFWVWDISMSKNAMKRGLWGKDKAPGTWNLRQELLGKGPRVTAVNGDGTREMIFTPKFTEPEGKALWGRLFSELREIMKKRGLEDTMLIGMISDLGPDKEDVVALKEITGSLAWGAQCHPSKLYGKKPVGNNIVSGVADLGHLAHVYAIAFQVNPEEGRMYGWKSPVYDCHYYRGRELLQNAIDVKLHPEFNITGGQRGCGRIPADFWDACKNKRGNRAGKVMKRFPENLWRNLDISSWFLAPGPDKAVATTRLENLREGVQECEARIFLEDILTTPEKKSRLGDALALKIQASLDRRHLANWKTVWMDDNQLKSIGAALTGRNPEEGLWQALSKSGVSLPGYWDGEARKMRADNQLRGRLWWLEGWQQRNRELFTLCVEARQKLK